MKQTFIHRHHTPHLVLFFAGWGMDTNPFKTMETAGSDLLVCYDYRTLNFDEQLCSGYEEITLIAWSMGVWAATQVLQKQTLPLVRRIAINGTPYPVDDRRGIASATFEGTTEGLNEASLRKFQRRMCGSASASQNFLSVAPQRGVEEPKAELKAIGQQVATLPAATLRWDSAVVGTADRIFLPENQLHAWQGETSVIQMDAPHYADALFQWSEELFRWPQEQTTRIENPL